MMTMESGACDAATIASSVMALWLGEIIMAVSDDQEKVHAVGLGQCDSGGLLALRIAGAKEVSICTCT